MLHKVNVHRLGTLTSNNFNHILVLHNVDDSIEELTNKSFTTSSYIYTLNSISINRKFN